MKLIVPRTLLPSFRAALGVACIALAGASLAQSPAAPGGVGPDARLATELEQASHEQLKAIYVDCSNEAERRLLGAGKAAACSIVYETLKRRVFGGDFAALYAWSRSLRA